MTNNDRPTKNERRQHAREVARQRADAEKRRKRRNKWFLQGGLVLGVLAVAAVVVLVVTRSMAPAGPGPLNMASDGIVLSGDGTTISATSSTNTAPRDSRSRTTWTLWTISWRT